MAQEKIDLASSCVLNIDKAVNVNCHACFISTSFCVSTFVIAGGQWHISILIMENAKVSVTVLLMKGIQ